MIIQSIVFVIENHLKISPPKNNSCCHTSDPLPPTSHMNTHPAHKEGCVYLQHFPTPPHPPPSNDSQREAVARRGAHHSPLGVRAWGRLCGVTNSPGDAECPRFLGRHPTFTPLQRESLNTEHKWLIAHIFFCTLPFPLCTTMPQWLHSTHFLLQQKLKTNSTLMLFNIFH